MIYDDEHEIIYRIDQSDGMFFVDDRRYPRLICEAETVRELRRRLTPLLREYGVAEFVLRRR